jgi:hypothetical protein
MSISVVHSLEVVDVDHEQTEFGSSTSASLQFMRQPLVESTLVVEAGEPVPLDQGAQVLSALGAKTNHGN